MNNLIGISGKMGSGKDLVGEIIQYLDVNCEESFEEDLRENTLNFEIRLAKEFSDWEIKKFADKLKDITCLLIGCTREQLESQEFKAKELGKEWQGYQVSWDCPVNEWEGWFKTEKEALNYLNDNDAKVDFKEAYLNKLIRKITLTPRTLLQLLGTECGRQIIHPNIWVNALFSEYKPKDAPYNSLGDLFNDMKYQLVNYPNWIITDLRFKNEAKVIKEKGGILIRINRPCEICGCVSTHKMDCQKGFEREHLSETDLDDYEDFDFIVTNDGSIKDLVEKIKLIKWKEQIYK